jgi:hypothetical protein
MRVSALGLAPIFFLSVVACGARTELAEAPPGFVLLDDGGLAPIDSGLAPDSAVGADGSVAPPIGTVDGGVVADAAAPRDAGATRDAAVPRDAGTISPDAAAALQTCTQCALQQCPTQAGACFANPACVQGLSCAAGCFAGGFNAQAFACVQACNIPAAQQQTIFGLLQCIGQRCQSQCAALAGG